LFCTDNEGDGNVNSAIMTFHDQNPSYECAIMSEEDPSRATSDTSVASLADFFKRPFVIQTVTWAVNGALDAAFQPWQLWADNPRVANRISNFRNFRGNLCIKVVLNGNQFYWGRGLLSYLPQPLASQGRTREATDFDRVPASQRPHLWIDPSSSMGGTMKLPFFWPQDAIDITGAEGGIRNFEAMGELWLTSVADLAHESSTDPITITFFAWMEDVHLSAPTQANKSSLSPQAGELEVGAGSPGAEFGKGPISKPASVLASVADALSVVPSIRPFAMATSMAAGALGRLATLYGFSRPQVIEGIRRRKIWNTGNIANSDAEDTCEILAFATKQEVSVDPRIVGLRDADELSVNHLAGKESWLCVAPWLKSNAVNFPIVSLPVYTQLFRIGERLLPPSETGIAHTPMSYIASAFRYWKGTIKFRFQVVASGYHKGRLLICWDPLTSSTNPEPNMVYSRIVDIAEQRDFTISVGWGSPKPMLAVNDPVLANPFAIGSTIGGNTTTANGILTVYVLNQLVSSGTSTAPVYLNVIVSCDDLELANPSPRIREYSPGAVPAPPPADLSPQAGELSDENTPGRVNAPEGAEVLEDMGNAAPTDYLAPVCMGERISSLRQLIKRYCYQDSVYLSLAAGPAQFFRFRHQRAIEPLIRGPDSNGIHTSAGESVNGNATTYIGFVSMMFSCWRGSIRYKIIPNVKGFTDPSRVTVCRIPSGYANNDNAVYASGTENLTFCGVNDQIGCTGCLVTTPQASNVLEVAFPYYHNERYFNVRWSNFKAPQELGMLITGNIGGDSVGAQQESFGMDFWVSAGEDYNLFFFLGAPQIWRVEYDPTPIPPP
jgi:hypothetical protein